MLPCPLPPADLVAAIMIYIQTLGFTQVVTSRFESQNCIQRVKNPISTCRIILHHILKPFVYKFYNFSL